jgi:hypothetical protein
MGKRLTGLLWRELQFEATFARFPSAFFILNFVWDQKTFLAFYKKMVRKSLNNNDAPYKLKSYTFKFAQPISKSPEIN